MKARHTNIEFDYEKIIDVYNRSGKAIAAEYVKENYNVEFYWVLKRLNKETDYIFERKGKRYVKKAATEAIFLSVNQLCEGKNVSGSVVAFECSNNSPDGVIIDLIKDKFFELSKYIRMEQCSKTVTFKKCFLERAGYKVFVE